MTRCKLMDMLAWRVSSLTREEAPTHQRGNDLSVAGLDHNGGYRVDQHFPVVTA